MSDIIVDPEFAALMPALSPDAARELEASILAEGCRDPLVVWEYEGRLLLLDGNNRYAVCTTHQVDFTVAVKTTAEIPDRNAAVEWILRNQLARRNLTRQQFRHYLGELYNRLKRQGARSDRTSGQTAQKSETAGQTTAEKLAKDHGVSEATVRRAGRAAANDKGKSAKTEKTSRPPTDAAERAIPEHLRELWTRKTAIRNLLRDLGRIEATVKAYVNAKDPVVGLMNPQSFQADYENLRRTLASALPHAICPWCGGDSAHCVACRGVGFINKTTYATVVPAEMES